MRYVPPGHLPFEFPKGQPLQRSRFPGFQRLHHPRDRAWAAISTDDTRNRTRFEGLVEAMQRVPLHAGRAASRFHRQRGGKKRAGERETRLLASVKRTRLNPPRCVSLDVPCAVLRLTRGFILNTLWHTSFHLPAWLVVNCSTLH